MNAPRKKNVVALPDSPDAGIGGAFKKHGNTALTVLLLVAAVYMFVRWRINTASAAKEMVAVELSQARTLVQELQPTRFRLNFAPEMLKQTTALQNDANTAITNVLNNSDATVGMRAEALTLRGDLYWELANLPPLPGSTTQPALRLAENSDSLLQKASDAYQEVLKNSTYANEHERIASCHLGLAAIAENRGDFKAAESELNLVKNDADVPVLQLQATRQLQELPEIQKKIYLAPPTGIAPLVVAPPTTQIGSPAPVMMPTTQLSLPRGLDAPGVPATMPALKP